MSRQKLESEPLVGTRVSTGIAALDELLGRQRDAPAGIAGFHVPSIVLLTGAPGVGKTTLLHEMLGICGLPSLRIGGVRMPGSVIRLVANVLPTETESVLILDGTGPLTSEEILSLRGDKRLVIIVQHVKEKKVLSDVTHAVSVWLHMERLMDGHAHVGTALSCREKNRFGPTGEIFRLTGESVWTRSTTDASVAVSPHRVSSLARTRGVRASASR